MNNMIPLEYIILFAMAIVEVIRKRMPDTYGDLKPFIAFTIAIGCNVLNAAIFGGSMLAAGRDSFIAAGVALAMFGSGTVLGNIISKSSPKAVPAQAVPAQAAPAPLEIKSSTTPEVMTQDNSTSV